MPSKALQQKDSLIESVVSVVQKKLPKGRATAAETFIRLYYKNVPPDDMLREEEDNLYGAALGLWQFGGTRKAGEPKIRVYNPQYDEHGWHAHHTVVEIVNDDMPFLVDSVTAALNGLGLTVHLVIHPLAKIVRDASGQVTELHDPSASPNGAIRNGKHVSPSCAGSGVTLSGPGAPALRCARNLPLPRPAGFTISNESESAASATTVKPDSLSMPLMVCTQIRRT